MPNDTEYSFFFTINNKHEEWKSGKQSPSFHFAHNYTKIYLPGDVRIPEATKSKMSTSHCVLACQNEDYGDFVDDTNIVAIVGGTHK